MPRQGIVGFMICTYGLARGLGHGLASAAVAVWPAVALVGSCELLMMVIRSPQVPGSRVPSSYARFWARSTVTPQDVGASVMPRLGA